MVDCKPILNNAVPTEKPLKTIVGFDFQRLRFYSPNVLAIGSSGKKVRGGGSCGPRTPSFRKMPPDPTLMAGDCCCCCFFCLGGAKGFFVFGPSKNAYTKFAKNICFCKTGQVLWFSFVLLRLVLLRVYMTHASSCIKHHSMLRGE